MGELAILGLVAVAAWFGIAVVDEMRTSGTISTAVMCTVVLLLCVVPFFIMVMAKLNSPVTDVNQ